MLPIQRKEYAPGDVIIDKYRLLQLLGEGGMGSVWVAENTALKANVALKLIRADVAEASANDRFLSEARLAARLQHPAIVRVFDFGKTLNDEPFIVMELLEGETLGQRLTRLGSIDPVELCQTLLPIIDALHSAHGHGVIHRDLKPDNVFISKGESGGIQPKLLDFGIAKLRGESAFHTTKLTQAGTLIGSPDYMSPEQARGETDLDPRSDVWALCVLAYECLVGKPPFHGDNYNALLWSIIHDEPVPITVFQAGDSELWRLLKTGFAKDRTGRWDSARKFGEALALWLENHGIVEDVCNRSLHASWLPAERPTQPELAPFDPMAVPLGQRASSHAALVPPPTLPALRRPHPVGLWMAGLGLLTLLGAWFLSTTGKEESALALPTPSAETTRTKALKPEPERFAQAANVPGPVEIIDDDSAPIGHATEVSGKARETGLNEPTQNPSSRGKTAPVDYYERQFNSPKGVDTGAAQTGGAQLPANAAVAASKPVVKSNPPPRPKKPAAPKKQDPDDYDFGI